MQTAFRNPPSGPHVTVNSQPVAVGQGMVLRKLQATAATEESSVTVSPTPQYIAPNSMTLTLPNPSPDLAYAAEVTVQAVSTASSLGNDIVLELVASYDDWATVFPLASVAHHFSSRAAIEQIGALLPITLGADLSASPINHTEMQVRARVYSTALSGAVSIQHAGTPGGAWLTLNELAPS